MTPAPATEPGTGTQYHTVATATPEDDPTLATDLNDKTGLAYDRARLEATQFRLGDRIWQCGGVYWDVEQSDIVELTAVVRKSSWCTTEPVENGHLEFHFEPARGSALDCSLTYKPLLAEKSEDCLYPDERFLPRHSIPFDLPP